MVDEELRCIAMKIQLCCLFVTRVQTTICRSLLTSNYITAMKITFYNYEAIGLLYYSMQVLKL